MCAVAGNSKWIDTELMIEKGSIVLVTGATGFTGSHLIRKLSAMGLEIRAIARPSSDISKFDDVPVKWFRGEVYDPETVKEAMHNVNFVFHVAAAFREAKIQDKQYELVHIESTRLLAQQAASSRVFKRFVHISTVGVHGHIAQPPADESYSFSPGDIYQKTKADAESWLVDFATTSGLRYTIVRPAAIYGPGDRRLLKLFKMAKLRVCPLLGIGHLGLYHLVHVEDLVNFMVVASVSDQSENEIYICGSEKAWTIKKILSTVGEFQGRSPLFIRVPVTPVFWLGDVVEAICKPLGIEPPIYRRRIAFFTKDRSFNVSKMNSVNGFKLEYTVEQGLHELFQWYKKHGWL